MASRLEQLLEPGERVLWRASRFCLPDGFWTFALVGPGIAAIVVLYLQRYDWQMLQLAVFMTVLTTAIACVIPWIAWVDAGELVITNRRALRRTRKKGRERLTSVSLPDIAAVSLGCDDGGLFVEIERQSGDPYFLIDLAQPQKSATMLAKCAGLPAPALIGRLKHLTVACVTLGGIPLGLLSFVPVARLHPLYQSNFEPTMAWNVLVTLSLVPGFWFGSLFALFLAVILMPWFASTERANAWFNLGIVGPGSIHHALRWTGWKHPFFSKLASWRYGQSIGRRDMGGASHGV